MQVVQCKVEWFNHNWSEGMVKQNGATLNKMVSLDIQLLVPKPPKIQQWSRTSQDWSCLGYVESDLMFFMYFAKFYLKKKES